jgi:hypothetical protein
MARQTVYQPGTVEPGWTTKEFYQTVFVHVIAGVIAIVTLAKAGFSPDGVQAAVPAVALAASAIAQAAYSVSRSRVEGSAATSVASSVTAPGPAVSGGTPPTTGATAERPRTPGDQVPPLPSVTLTFSGLAVPQLAGQQPGSQNAGTAG